MLRKSLANFKVALSCLEPSTDDPDSRVNITLEGKSLQQHTWIIIAAITLSMGSHNEPSNRTLTLAADLTPANTTDNEPAPALVDGTESPMSSPTAVSPRMPDVEPPVLTWEKAQNIMTLKKVWARQAMPETQISAVFTGRLLDGAAVNCQLDTSCWGEGLSRGREPQHRIRVVRAQESDDIHVCRRQQ